VLETLNSLLSAGEAPGLYTSEELEPLLQPLREAMLEDGRYRTVQEYFTARVQRNLHIALAMDPTHAQVRTEYDLRFDSFS
jgi:dynein heavy chain 2, cytosolic